MTSSDYFVSMCKQTEIHNSHFVAIYSGFMGRIVYIRHCIRQRSDALRYSIHIASKKSHIVSKPRITFPPLPLTTFIFLLCQYRVITMRNVTSSDTCGELWRTPKSWLCQ